MYDCSVKKYVKFLLILILTLSLTGCRHGQTDGSDSRSEGTSSMNDSNSTGVTSIAPKEPFIPDPDLQQFQPAESDLELLEAELRKCFDFFYETANSDPESPGYGLIPDRMPSNPDVSSIASVGYGLAALCIGDMRRYAAADELYFRALRTMETLRDLPGQHNGFFYHFLDMKSGRRAWNSELSVIDTAICMNGILMAGEYFGGEVELLAREVYERVQWDWYINPQTGHFYMGYTPESGFFGAWDMTAEQKMMYILAAASPTYPVDPDMFYRFGRPKGSYGGLPQMIRSPGGSLFVYQFSHAWYDFRLRQDKLGVDWFFNSLVATLANRRYAVDQMERLNTGPDDWGFTACDGPSGYDGSYGAPPRAITGREDGTVPPCGPAGSIVFTPEYSVSALRNMFETVPGIWGKWGFKDAYNRNFDPIWVAGDVIGIDKGITMLMLENYLSGFVWSTLGNCAIVQDGMDKINLEYSSPAEEAIIHAVVIDGGRKPGDTVKVIWHEWEPEGADIVVASIDWYISVGLTGPWRKIDTAAGKEYQLQDEDAGHFIMCQITGAVDADGEYMLLDPVSSEPFGTVMHRN